MTDAPDPMVGTTVLGRYRIVARLAAGGMGVVYLARAEGAAGFAKPVVVKRVLPSLNGSDQMARLFIREAKILANLQHPNIVGVIDFGEENGAYLMVLDYVRAYDVGVWAYYRRGKGGHLPIEGVLHILIKVLDALEYAHTLALPDGTPLDIIHADVSPSNILVDTDGQVKLLDFGIARMRGEVTKSTESASIRGKFSYLPVEALDGSPPRVTTDVYACGVTLYELLAGDNPFMVEDDTVTIARVISHEPPPLSQLREGVSPELDAVVARAMARDREKRFASAKDFARELRRIQHVPEDEAVASLATLAKQDYAEMPAVAGVSLAELEEAWRNPPASILRDSARKIEVVPSSRRESASKIELALAPTIPPGTPRAADAAVSAAAIASPEPARKKWSAATLALAASIPFVLAAGITALVLYLRHRPEPEDPKIVVIERGPSTPPSDSSPSPKIAAALIASAAPSAAASTTSPPGPTREPAPKTTKPAAAGDPLSAAFAKKQPEIEACFRQEAAGVSGAPEISVRFSIDAEGTVQRVEISPSELAGVPLGQCILSVAKKTAFPPQEAPKTFRIPLRARRAQ